MWFKVTYESNYMPEQFSLTEYNYLEACCCVGWKVVLTKKAYYSECEDSHVGKRKRPECHDMQRWTKNTQASPHICFLATSTALMATDAVCHVYHVYHGILALSPQVDRLPCMLHGSISSWILLCRPKFIFGYLMPGATTVLCTRIGLISYI